MGLKRFTAEGEEQELDENATVADLKERVGAGANDIATYKDADGSWVTMADRDQIRHIPDESKVTFQPPARFGGGD